MTNCTCVEDIPMFEKIVYSSFAVYLLVVGVLIIGYITCNILPECYRDHRNKVWLRKKKFTIDRQKIEQQELEQIESD